MNAMLRDLLKLGIERLALDSVSGLEWFYSGFGFRPHRKWVTIRTPIPALPQVIPALEDWHPA